ncbi:MAG: 50S ribosome-binding GTPase [Candidatus Marinimicrobia bacterium]|nr:50S ribosome-binding GTPase [Candidatus Neomarinimicrobiota bacterium]
MNEIFELIVENVIPKLPEPIRSLVEAEISKLREVIMEARAPRFAIVGRRGAGKSSLINAIFSNKVAEVGDVKSTTGIGKWYDYEDEKRKMSILDSRGLGEGSIPDMEVKKKSAEEEVKASIDHKCPDALLFLGKADEIDARIDEDLKSFLEIKSYVQKKYTYNPPVVGVMTQVDKLAPAQVLDPPYKDERKQKNIAYAKALLTRKIETLFDDTIEVIPISAYIDFSNGKIVYDGRWNIDKLVEYLIECLPRSAQMEFARIARVKSVQKKMARILIGSAATIAGGVGLEPIPVADLPVITSIQIGMIIGIGYISGREMNKKSAVEFMTSMGLNVGLSFVFRELARALVKLIPVAGNAVSGAVAAASTWGIGEATIAYFIDKKSPDEAKQIFEQERKKRQEEK